MIISDERLKFIASGERFSLSTAPSWGEAQQMARELQQLRASHEELMGSLHAASHALRSFQYGNSSDEFAKDSADYCDAALANAQKVRE